MSIFAILSILTTFKDSLVSSVNREYLEQKCQLFSATSGI